MMSNEVSERRRRRSWTDAEKREIVAETEVPGASVSVVARRHDINANLLFKWKRQFDRDDAKDVAVPVSPEFIPLGMFAASSEGGRGDGRSDRRLPSPLDGRVGLIEIDLLCGARVRVDGDVDERALRRALKILKQVA